MCTSSIFGSVSLASWKRWKRQVRFAMSLWPLYRIVVLRVSPVRLSKDLIEWLINQLFWRYPESWGQKSLYSLGREFTILFPALHLTSPAGSLWELCRTICFRPSWSSGRLTAQRFFWGSDRFDLAGSECSDGVRTSHLAVSKKNGDPNLPCAYHVPTMRPARWLWTPWWADCMQITQLPEIVRRFEPELLDF